MKALYVSLVLCSFIVVLTLPAERCAASENSGGSASDGRRITRVSVNSSGEQANGYPDWPAVSGDGRFVVFQSDATNLVPGDTNGKDDIFVHDRLTGMTTRASVSSCGDEGDGWSFGPGISEDGRFVTTTSYATNLVPGDTNGVRDVFVHDRETGVTERVSVSSAGAQGDAAICMRSINADGRFVCFTSHATNLVPGDTNGAADVFVRDLECGFTERVSVSSSGDEADGESVMTSVSGDGRFVAFDSDATNLVPGDTNGKRDIFVHDRDTGETRRVSVSSSGAEGDGKSWVPRISSDGRVVAFGSWATNLVPGDRNGERDIFVRDLETGTTERVSVSSSGREADDQCRMSSISSNGRFVAFASYATNLVIPRDYKGEHIFVRDREAGRTVCLTESEGDPDNNCMCPRISADGRWVVFDSLATNLVPGDTNGKGDIFVVRNPLAP